MLNSITNCEVVTTIKVTGQKSTIPIALIKKLFKKIGVDKISIINDVLMFGKLQLANKYKVPLTVINYCISIGKFKTVIYKSGGLSYGHIYSFYSIGKKQVMEYERGGITSSIHGLNDKGVKEWLKRGARVLFKKDRDYATIEPNNDKINLLFEKLHISLNE